mmetsp:Transcript_36326/g.56765  ORF Transcript_36326/g.56765 Transcript_36326/m.56765 type:complete len:99 (-) Transcript_36326:324-620(-)
MVSSQTSYLQSLLNGMDSASSPGPAASPSTPKPVKKLKIEHIQRAMEGQGRELRDLLNLCSEQIEELNKRLGAEADKPSDPSAQGLGLHRRHVPGSQI